MLTNAMGIEKFWAFFFFFSLSAEGKGWMPASPKPESNSSSLADTYSVSMRRLRPGSSWEEGSGFRDSLLFMAILLSAKTVFPGTSLGVAKEEQLDHLISFFPEQGPSHVYFPVSERGGPRMGRLPGPLLKQGQLQSQTEFF